MPKLIIVNGLPASGKTTLVELLSKDLQYPAFSKDDFKELLADAIGFTDHESTRAFGKTSFALLFFVARRCLENKISLIIEGNFMSGEETNKFISYLQDSKVEVREVLCHAEGQVLIDRFSARKRHPVHHTFAGEKLQEYMETTLRKGKDAPFGVGELLEVDTTDPTTVRYDAILSFVRS